MLVALTASALAGQPDSARGLQTIGHLPTTTFYKIHTHNRSILYGRILGISRDSFRLTSGGAARSDTSAALRDITAVWFRHGSEGGKGLLIGTGIGVGLGLLLGSRDAGGDPGDGRILLATLLGCAGGLSGILVGMNTDHYTRIPWP